MTLAPDFLLSTSLRVTRPGTLVMGTGLATLIPRNGNPAVEISDVDNVIIFGLTIDVNSADVVVDHVWLWRADHVKTHEAWGIGIYNVFYDAPLIVDNAIETPPGIEDNMHHLVIYWLNGNKGSVVKSIINGKGGSINIDRRKAVK